MNKIEEQIAELRNLRGYGGNVKAANTMQSLSDKYQAVCDEHEQQVEAWCELKVRNKLLEEALEGLHFHHKKFEPLCKHCVNDMMIVDAKLTED